MAHDAYDSRKRVISKHFRRMLEVYDRQPFFGPPENAREAVMAASKALQKGDWRECQRHVMGLAIWDKMLNKDHIQEMLVQKIKVEAMRTYIFTVRLRRTCLWRQLARCSSFFCCNGGALEALQRVRRVLGCCGLQYLPLYDSFAMNQLSNMFELSLNAVHSVVSKVSGIGESVWPFRQHAHSWLSAGGGGADTEFGYKASGECVSDDHQRRHPRELGRNDKLYSLESSATHAAGAAGPQSCGRACKCSGAE